MSYGPDHIYTRIAAVHGNDPALVARACELAKEHGICVQTYADPVCVAAMLAHMGYIAKAAEQVRAANGDTIADVQSVGGDINDPDEGPAALRKMFPL